MGAVLPSGLLIGGRILALVILPGCDPREVPRAPWKLRSVRFVTGKPLSMQTDFRWSGYRFSARPGNLRCKALHTPPASPRQRSMSRIQRFETVHRCVAPQRTTPVRIAPPVGDETCSTNTAPP